MWLLLAATMLKHFFATVTMFPFVSDSTGKSLSKDNRLRQHLAPCRNPCHQPLAGSKARAVHCWHLEPLNASRLVLPPCRRG